MCEEKKVKWKDTLNLPSTGFPMKASLNVKEPQILKKWEEKDLYNTILELRADCPSYILHDGPPYANGEIHLGHALNKILKDFIVKTKSMEGFKAPLIPGWDCHGLPIEINIDKKLGKKKRDLTTVEFREQCREYAEKYLDLQREGFKRLGVFADWENPYKTINPSYEASIISTFRSFAEKGNVVRKKRPVYWCNSCRTALAEAEVEYANHKSPSIYVKFELEDVPEFLTKHGDKQINVMIWTTTPWTIPANLAIALHADFDYALFDMDGERYIAASRLVPLLAEVKGAEYKIIEEFKGVELKGCNAKHPLFDRKSLIINTDYVELEAGTGCVHTAPGHGDDDYRAGLEYGLDIYSPVNSGGRFDETAGKYEGLKVFEANSVIIEDLKESGRLFHTNDIEHSYPHCWRCKKPVIFRATEQWFISMDTAELRQKALEEIKKVNWLPSWGEERISNMIANRPDWCISRQRDWGVPIPVFYCESCDEPEFNIEAIRKVEEIFAEEGSEAWYKDEEERFLPSGTKCSKCGHEKFKKGRDILDVWFESGASWDVLNKRENHSFPADMYLEGGDQYRGWFHSSLLVGVSSKEMSPYKTVITHGWALDKNGRAMSKSLGNVIKPQKIIDEKGAEILRLWIAMVNYREDIRLGNEILARVTESYRKVRNTWRFMLGVLGDFNPDTDSVDIDNMREVDLYILDSLQKLKDKVLTSYRNYEYHTIYHAISNFFTTDLSSFYLNFMKDILYCNGKESVERRSGQTAVFTLLKETLLLMTPILSFTTEEAWDHLPQFEGKLESVHMHTFPEMDNRYSEKLDCNKWEMVMEIRELILKELEAARNEKVIGDSLEASVTVDLSEEKFAVASDLETLIKEILVVSEVSVNSASEDKVSVAKVEGNKCPRCWNWFTEDTSDNKFENLCPRCNNTALEMGIEAAE